MNIKIWNHSFFRKRNHWCMHDPGPRWCPVRCRLYPIRGFLQTGVPYSYTRLWVYTWLGNLFIDFNPVKP